MSKSSKRSHKPIAWQEKFSVGWMIKQADNRLPIILHTKNPATRTGHHKWQ
ncbi:hypothetical protein Q2T42_01425 [Leptolyngbya boryana CZ1]|uniref:Uncharacterized protein n=1 Tax=Leptolyngbya boryana CZ1 TaxID=3060204 RepID=A0AA97AWM8_LEPBY|nr:hypothetical protein [Leptolyngbya boryana]WNZ46496.1 hypothetical protein Q2T42_01425 [Leptolyngbya boryana CZ1]